MKTSKRMLLSSVCKPFGKKYGDGFSTKPIGLWQNCWVQGLFMVENIVLHWGLDVIAANTETPTKVLHYPSMRRFIAELQKEKYDYVGISFNACSFHKMEPMVEAVRKYSPQSEIILGGYGTTLSDDVLAPLCDHVCREEAIGFVRGVLGEPETDRPFNHPVVTAKNWLFSLPILGETGMITAGLGCPHGCDFCMTSHFFKRKHIRYLETGQDIVDTIHKIRRAKPGLDAFCIYDEDLLLNRRRGREFLDAMRKSDLNVNISIFASARALSHYEIEELAEMGISAMWVGYEAKRAGLSKMESHRTHHELAEECRKYGIGLVSSMIIGLDYQTPEIIREELDDFIRVNTTVPQFLIYGPSGGTPLLAKMKEEGRLNENYEDMRLHEGFSLLFDHPHISAPEMRELVMECFETEYQANGPTIYRGIEGSLITYKFLRNHKLPKLRARAEEQRKALEFSWGAYQVGLKHAPNEKVRQKIVDLYAEIERVIGKPSLAVRALSYAALPAAEWTKIRLSNDALMQPRTTVATYNQENYSPHASDAWRTREPREPVDIHVGERDLTRAR